MILRIEYCKIGEDRPHHALTDGSDEAFELVNLLIDATDCEVKQPTATDGFPFNGTPWVKSFRNSFVKKFKYELEYENDPDRVLDDLVRVLGNWRNFEPGQETDVEIICTGTRTFGAPAIDICKLAPVPAGGTFVRCTSLDGSDFHPAYWQTATPKLRAAVDAFNKSDASKNLKPGEIPWL
jgi:hypothetical protein